MLQFIFLLKFPLWWQLLGPIKSDSRSLFHFQDIQEAHAGQIVAVFGIECASGTVETSSLLVHN